MIQALERICGRADIDDSVVVEVCEGESGRRIDQVSNSLRGMVSDGDLMLDYRSDGSRVSRLASVGVGPVDGTRSRNIPEMLNP